MSYITDGSPLLFVANDNRGGLAQAIQDVARASPQAGFIQARATGTLSLPNDASFNRITFDSTIQNVGGIATITASPWSLTIAKAGWYTFLARIVLNVSVISPHVGIYVNYNATNNAMTVNVYPSTDFYIVNASLRQFCNVGDVAYITAAHYGGGTVDVNPTSEITFSL